MNVLGQTAPDPVGELLGTGYLRFESETGICGLAKPSKGATLEVLAIAARKAGNGQFREFIAQAKAQYATIKIYDVTNPFLPEVLERYGFRSVIERTMLYDGTTEEIDGYRWDK